MIEEIIDNTSFVKLHQSTVTLLSKLSENKVRITDSVYNKYEKHVLSTLNIDNKDLFKSILRDCFSQICSIKEIKVKKKTTKKTTQSSNKEVEFISTVDDLEKFGLEKEVEQPNEPCDWFLSIANDEDY